MTNKLKFLLLLLSPFILMVMVNETCRPFIKDKPFQYLNIHAINSVNYDNEKCTWACHNSTTNHCLKKHTKIIKQGFPFYKQINNLYWGIINFNSQKVKGKKVSNPKYYAAMNIIFLVVIWPLSIFLLLANFLRLRTKSKKQHL